MLKKYLSFLMAVTLIIGLAGCRKTGSGSESDSNTSSEVKTVYDNSTDNSSDNSEVENNGKNESKTEYADEKTDEITDSVNSSEKTVYEDSNKTTQQDKISSEKRKPLFFIDAVKDEIKKGKYSYSWGDEFDGSAINSRNWKFGGGSAPGDTAELRTEDCISVSNGLLHMSVDKYFDYTNKDIKYKQPALLTTAETVNFRYGYLEMRARLPYKHSAWPAFWLMSGQLIERSESRKYGAEIDIFEVFSSHNELGVTVHKHYLNGSGTVQRGVAVYDFENFIDLPDEFHIYGFEWTPEKMIFSVDGKDFGELDITENGNFDADGFSSDMSGFHEGMYIMLDNWFFSPQSSYQPSGSAADSNTEFPLIYEVDWLRLYQDNNVQGTRLAFGE